jgi:hypothetical protein
LILKRGFQSLLSKFNLCRYSEAARVVKWRELAANSRAWIATKKAQAKQIRKTAAKAARRAAAAAAKPAAASATAEA